MTKSNIGTQKNHPKVFKVVDNECIWMKAGIVNFRLCDNAYDCNHCAFDKAMQRAMKSKHRIKETSRRTDWSEALRKRYTGSSRPCRHLLTGRIDAPKICTYNYECYHCAYDQMLDDQDLTLITDAPHYKLAAGYKVADGYYYHTGHSWARLEHGGYVRVGFDDFLVRLFGRFQKLVLPPLGAKLKQDQVGWVFSRDGHKAGVLSPVTGKVLAVNHNTREHPEIAHEDPYKEGWLFIVEPSALKKVLRQLYFGKECIQWMEMEGQKLMGLLGSEYEKLAATGGEPIDDFYGHFPGIGWESLAKTFLRAEVH
ncbi:MAG: glycine cleavage system protein H [Deltaproteobacteria bacterium]|nr:glycine cleavage system protein H [Deltaproteobacteria bacterium]MBW1993940.1 glycine cleavage system protein H [Deltaproteobacteria bacterium]MBW2151281.1 glycine cleavage system protein H [Deltaproteobacteria bacterium]